MGCVMEKEMKCVSDQNVLHELTHKIHKTAISVQLNKLSIDKNC